MKSSFPSLLLPPTVSSLPYIIFCEGIIIISVMIPEKVRKSVVKEFTLSFVAVCKKVLCAEDTWDALLASNECKSGERDWISCKNMVANRCVNTCCRGNPIYHFYCDQAWKWMYIDSVVYGREYTLKAGHRLSWTDGHTCAQNVREIYCLHDQQISHSGKTCKEPGVGRVPWPPLDSQWYTVKIHPNIYMSILPAMDSFRSLVQDITFDMTFQMWL